MTLSQTKQRIQNRLFKCKSTTGRTPSAVRDIVRMHGRGLSVSTIVIRLGLPVSAVMGVLNSEKPMEMRSV